ncbi:hypothetical protein [Acidithiobacillus acidisediminis]|uniref:hypothetical protein n=1 Tax=Acidithiobacillus acidisediminis TaxID=2937799 RepID=UPI0020107EB7|nr:hypothetical protein [Acidithiobacillus sp. S30A2]
MGYKVVNTFVGTDWARPSQKSEVELHMTLPVTPDLAKNLNNLIAAGSWEIAAKQLADVYPQHQDIIHKWFAASKERASSGESKTSSAA